MVLDLLQINDYCDIVKTSLCLKKERVVECKWVGICDWICQSKWFVDQYAEEDTKGQMEQNPQPAPNGNNCRIILAKPGAFRGEFETGLREDPALINVRSCESRMHGKWNGIEKCAGIEFRANIAAKWIVHECWRSWWLCYSPEIIWLCKFDSGWVLGCGAGSQVVVEIASRICSNCKCVLTL